MYPNYSNNFRPRPSYNNFRPNDRIVGPGFLGPFILGGITGGLLAPAFSPRPYPPVPPYPPGPPFRPYPPYPIYY